MVEILRTNDLVLISFIEAMLRAEGVACLVADQHGAAVEGGVIAVQRRVLVHRDQASHARDLVAAARAAADRGELEPAGVSAEAPGPNPKMTQAR